MAKLARGRITTIYLHWTAGYYSQVFDDYHLCIDQDGKTKLCGCVDRWVLGGVKKLIYFTSDLHFYHDNIIHHCQRPFWSSDDMNDSLIENWNDTVSPDDEVYILGDVTMEGPDGTDSR